jgi:IS30 family transposase
MRSAATMTRIAADLSRATSTVTREVHRNSDESGRTGRSLRTPGPWNDCPGPGSGG